jgi:hypothetical protein
MLRTGTRFPARAHQPFRHVAGAGRWAQQPNLKTREETCSRVSQPIPHQGSTWRGMATDQGADRAQAPGAYRQGHRGSGEIPRTWKEQR